MPEQKTGINKVPTTKVSVATCEIRSVVVSVRGQSRGEAGGTRPPQEYGPSKILYRGPEEADSIL